MELETALGGGNLVCMEWSGFASAAGTSAGTGLLVPLEEGATATIVTIQQARQILERHFAEHPPAISGDLYIAPEWYEDEQDFLPVWGSRQFLLEGREAFARWDNLVIFIDKRSGDVRKDLRNLNSKKVREMTPISVPA
jgi:hypothetical protein